MGTFFDRSAEKVPLELPQAFLPVENQYKLAVNFTAPNIPYRETITKSAEAMYRHKKQSGGSGQLSAKPTP